MSRATRPQDTPRPATRSASTATGSTRLRFRLAISVPELAGAIIIVVALFVALLHT